MLRGVAIAIALSLGACAQPDTVQSLCDRAQECNDYPDGVSHQDCIDLFDKCVDKLTTSQRNDWERLVNQCLSNDSCQLFDNCYGTVPWC
ncbi:MAG TPA: hypothetical protein VL463_00235 [Kofleriaceae bacterium]|nr:hypothetical protein [Kofleriaceae bacterium]